MANSRTVQLARRLRFIVLTALIVRVAYAAFVWTPYFRPQYTGTNMRTTVTAYSLSAGLGYSHYKQHSPAHYDMVALRLRADAWSRITPEDGDSISRDGLRPEFLYPPGWSLVGAGLHRATGAPVWLCRQAFGILCDTFAVVFVYLVIVRVTGSDRLGGGSAWAYAVFPPLAYSAVNLYTMSPVPAFVLCSTWLIVRGAQCVDRTRWLNYGAAGVFAAVAASFRSDFILMGPVLAIALWPSGLGPRHALAAAAVVGGITFALLTPWAMRNHALGAGWNFTSCGTGGVFINGLSAYPNNPWGFRPHDEGRWADVLEQGIDDPWGPEGDAYFRRRFRQAIVEHPGFVVRILTQRTLEGLVAPHDWGLNPMGKSIRGSELRTSGTILSNLGDIVVSLWPRAISGLVVVVGNIGCAFAFLRERHRNPLVYVVLAAPVYALLVHVMSHMMPMYLLPGVYAQLFGLVYLLSRGWRVPQSQVSPAVAADGAA